MDIFILVVLIALFLVVLLITIAIYNGPLSKLDKALHEISIIAKVQRGHGKLIDNITASINSLKTGVREYEKALHALENRTRINEHQIDWMGGAIQKTVEELKSHNIAVQLPKRDFAITRPKPEDE